jgi:hypothetical protein
MVRFFVGLLLGVILTVRGACYWRRRAWNIRPAGLHRFSGGISTVAWSVCRPVALGLLFSGNSKFAEIMESGSCVVSCLAGPFRSGPLGRV